MANYFSDAIKAIDESIDNAKKAANWLWGLLQGDFNENQTPNQVIANAGISITVTATGIGVVVAWLLDLRDFCACVYLIHKEGSKSGGFKANDVSFLKWFLLVIMLIGLIPVLGDLLKGVLRIIYLELKVIAKTSSHLTIAKQFGQAIDASMPYIEKLLRHEAVRKYLAKIGWQRPFKEMAKALKANYAKITSFKEIIKIYDNMIAEFKNIFNKLKKYLPSGAEVKFNATLKMLNEVRDGLNNKATSLTKPLRDCIDVLIIKLEKKDLALYRVATGSYTPHYYGRVNEGTKAYNEAKKLPFLKDTMAYEPLIVKGSVYQKLLKKYQGSKTSLDLTGSEWVIPTFAKIMKIKTIKGPATLYRVIDPASGTGSFHWVTESVFKQLKTRNQWRDKLAVRVDWNANGQYVTMTIPKGKELKVYAGPAASQEFPGTNPPLYYSGGAEQIVFNTKFTSYKISARKETPWGYIDNDPHHLNQRVVINLKNGSAK